MIEGTVADPERRRLLYRQPCSTIERASLDAVFDLAVLNKRRPLARPAMDDLALAQQHPKVLDLRSRRRSDAR